MDDATNTVGFDVVGVDEGSASGPIDAGVDGIKGRLDK